MSADLPTGSEPDESEDTESGTASDDTETDEQGAMGRQIALVVGGALALVLGLFFVTQWSNQQEWGSSSSSNSPSAEAGAGGSSPTSSRPPGEQSSMGASGQQRGEGSLTDLRTLLDQTADSLTGPTAAQIDSLRSRVEQASGTNKRQLQAELVNLYIGAGYPGRATLVQRELADATGTVDAQRRSADLLYRWMQKLQQQGQRKQIIQVARHASKAYARVVEQRPDDLDARTRMGEAYLLTNKPMRGIEAINAVLDDDSTFVPARFQKGLALLQINRLDQSMEQFRRVKRYAEDGSSFYRRAEQALKIIKQRRSDASSGGAAPPGADP